jgi:hypothetical protein
MDTFYYELNNLLNMTEDDILNTSNYSFYMKNLLVNRQFSEQFLIKTHNLYESSDCITSQHNLTPLFCFKYLLNNPNDSAEEKVTIYDILRYITNTYPDILLQDVMNQYELVLTEKENLQNL